MSAAQRVGTAAAPGARTRPRRRRFTWRSLASPAVIAPLVLGVVVIAAWQAGLFHSAFNLKPYTVPYPSAILDAIGRDGDHLMKHVMLSLPGIVFGYATGAILGFAIATALVRFAPRLISQLLPVISATNALPIVALAPVVGLFVGYGLPVKIIVVAFMTTPVMVVYTIRGLTSVDAEARELMASIESTPGQVYRYVQIPTALPYIFTALKSMVVLALIGVIVTEAMRGFEGLGFVISDAMSGFEAATAWLALVTIAVIGIVSYLIVGLVERLVIPWDSASRTSS
jgi:NitT/TauT family transport system permease protein